MAWCTGAEIRAKGHAMTDTDLFGEPVIGALPCVNGGKRKTVAKGYAAPPGSGPPGETCKTCEHYARIRRGNTYRKCALMKPHWTGGPGTDILARSPACRFWEEAKE